MLVLDPPHLRVRPRPSGQVEDLPTGTEQVAGMVVQRSVDSPPAPLISPPGFDSICLQTPEGTFQGAEFSAFSVGLVDQMFDFMVQTFPCLSGDRSQLNIL